MSMLYFAHNGVDHATHTEAAAHESNTVLWVIAITLAMTAVIFTIARSLNKSGQKAQPQEQEEEE